MTPAALALTAAAVTLSGTLGVAVAAYRLSRDFPARATPLAAVLLLAFAAGFFAPARIWPLVDLAVLAGALGGAILLGRSLTSPAAVVVFLAVAGIVDALSMSGGATRWLFDAYQRGTSDAVLHLALDIPVRGRVVPVVGFGDLLVGGAAAAALMRAGVSPARVLGALALGMLAALAWGLARGGAPALPFVAVALTIAVVTRRGRSRSGPGAPA